MSAIVNVNGRITDERQAVIMNNALHTEFRQRVIGQG